MVYILIEIQELMVLPLGRLPCHMWNIEPQCPTASAWKVFIDHSESKHCSWPDPSRTMGHIDKVIGDQRSMTPRPCVKVALVPALQGGFFGVGQGLWWWGSLWDGAGFVVVVEFVGSVGPRFMGRGLLGKGRGPGCGASPGVGFVGWSRAHGGAAAAAVVVVVAVAGVTEVGSLRITFLSVLRIMLHRP